MINFLTRPPNALSAGAATQMARAWHMETFAKGSCLVRQGDTDPMEWVLLDGRVSSQITDPDGRAVCVGLYAGPCVIAPAIARTRDGVSLVSLEVSQDALVAKMASSALTDLMLGSEPIRDWANTVLQQELAHKADREWCLAALGGADRLAWFRERYPGYEQLFGHSLIASFLGVTPVTFSRLRGATRS